jgi:hypothetical protein
MPRGMPRCVDLIILNNGTFLPLPTMRRLAVNLGGRRHVDT